VVCAAAAAAVYDVTRAETFTNLESIWMKEVDIYSNVEAAVKMVVANKVDLVRHTCSARCCLSSHAVQTHTAGTGLPASFFPNSNCYTLEELMQ
jgi:GTPase SAR1 family protein